MEYTQKVLGQTVIDKVFANFSVLWQVGRFTSAFYYPFLMIFRCFRNALSTVLVFFTLIIPGSRDIVQVMQTIQIDLQKFRFTEPGSNLAFVLKNIAQNFNKMQKDHVIAFNKIKQ